MLQMSIPPCFGVSACVLPLTNFSLRTLILVLSLCVGRIFTLSVNVVITARRTMQIVSHAFLDKKLVVLYLKCPRLPRVTAYFDSSLWPRLHTCTAHVPTRHQKPRICMSPSKAIKFVNFAHSEFVLHPFVLRGCSNWI